MRGSAVAAAATTGRATTGPAVTGLVPPAAAGAAGGAAAGGAAAPGAAAGVTGTGGGATCPSGVMRNTISTPFFPSGEGSFSTACSRRKSIASRMLASRNSTRGIMIVFSLFVIRAVPLASLANAPVSCPTVSPYLRTGSSQPFSTCQSWRDRVSLYASSPYLYLVLLIFSWPRRAATLYGSRLSTWSYRLNARSYRPDWYKPSASVRSAFTSSTLAMNFGPIVLL